MPDDQIPMSLGRCFIMQPFDKGTYDKRYKDIFEPAIQAALLEPYRVDNDPTVDVPIDKIESEIRDSIVCFAEISEDNPNVWYELGYARANGKQICMVCSSKRKKFPFDIQHRSIIRYETASISDYQELRTKITNRLNAMLKTRSTIEDVSALSPTTQTEGLSAHEMSVLALIMAHFPDTAIRATVVKNEMVNAGYTNIASGIAIQKLRQQDYIKVNTIDEFNEGEVTYLILTPKGNDWVIRNEHLLALRTVTPDKAAKARQKAIAIELSKPPKIAEGDIPF